MEADEFFRQESAMYIATHLVEFVHISGCNITKRDLPCHKPVKGEEELNEHRNHNG